MIGRIIGFIIVIGLGLFATCAFILANEIDKINKITNEDKDE